MHRLTIHGSLDYTLQLALKVTGEDTVVEGTNINGPLCWPSEVRDLVWPMSKISVEKTYKGLNIVILADPELGDERSNRPKNFGMECPLNFPMMIGCTKRMVILEATSEPSGAEIWINGEKQDYNTNKTLSIPYCKDDVHGCLA